MPLWHSFFDLSNYWINTYRRTEWSVDHSFSINWLYVWFWMQNIDHNAQNSVALHNLSTLLHTEKYMKVHKIDTQQHFCRWWGEQSSCTTSKQKQRRDDVVCISALSGKGRIEGTSDWLWINASTLWLECVLFNMTKFESDSNLVNLRCI